MSVNVQINVTESVSPKNGATLDRPDLNLIGNAYSKAQVEDKLTSVAGTSYLGELPKSYNFPITGSYTFNPIETGVYIINGHALPAITQQDFDDYLVITIRVTEGVPSLSKKKVPTNVADFFDPNDSIKAQGGQQIADYVNFTIKPFNYTLDLTKDNYGKYTELTGIISFSEGSNSVFGKIAFVKLTGGNVTFSQNFIAQLGSGDYDPLKTNVIAFWKEYDKVRYFIEVFPLEPVPVDGLISYYNFNGKVPNALLSAIPPNYGPAFIGNTSGFKMNSSGGWLQQIYGASSVNSAIAINVGAVTNYKVSIYVSVAQELEINIGTTAYNVWNDYVNIQFNSTSRIQHVTPSTPSGTIIYSSNTIEYPNNGFYLWEFQVNGNEVKVYYQGQFLVSYTHTNTGNLFSMIFKNSGDNFQSIKIEEL